MSWGGRRVGAARRAAGPRRPRGAVVPLGHRELRLGAGDHRHRPPWRRRDRLGEDVVYEAEEHTAPSRRHGPALDVVGEHTLAEFCAGIEATDLFPTGAPDHDVSRNYRRWAWESAALDLALRQAGTDLGTILELEPQPVTFVASPRLGEPASVGALDAHLAAVPDLRFKLDAAPDWDDAFLADLAALDRTDCVDLKAFYTGTVVDVEIPPTRPSRSPGRCRPQRSRMWPQMRPPTD